MQTLIVITLTLMHQLKPKLSQLNNFPSHDNFFSKFNTNFAMISTIILLITLFD
jgi:hypothetical protein